MSDANQKEEEKKIEITKKSGANYRKQSTNKFFKKSCEFSDTWYNLNVPMHTTALD